ncbi:proton-conducting transporter membrane subunit [Marinithermus hydrothermalis]|uniref:NADH dehydrogenase (Quinone) n=1 Tax=Marinithermus hydrothermalis (strain DSM 14884 / JCM 11576 / T1) TaxID=869210 RepID=F2NMV9_MARHT|nr:proton-conducting transporter membrane subunit [Marinithermus hydrothermalis]AEB12698.1 NADH dehydrogenase (quinone) [Marinithermus hydrothermalis DSM 14884]
MSWVAFLIPWVPLLSAVTLAFVRDERTFPRLSTGLTFLAFALNLLALFTTEGGTYAVGVLAFYTDNLGLLLSAYILLVSLVVHKYSEKYMADEEGYRRFYILLDLMTASLVLLVLTANLLLLLLCWHLTGLLLYLLLNQNHKRAAAQRYANLAFFTQRLADLPLLLAVLLLFKEFGTLNLPEISAIALTSSAPVFPTVTLLVTLSAILKSAQFLFHHWIVYTMEGPTPLSALMHAGIVNAGAFLVNRFAPLYVHDTLGLTVAFIVGSVTAVMGSVLMLMQSDVKKSLGYSTVGQMGYMVMELGVGALALAVYHMMTHGIFKATLFLYSGNAIHSARRDPNLPEDAVYSALTQKGSAARKVPWIVYGFFTVAIPLLIVLLTHYLFEEKVLQRETYLVILFFGWVTAAQALVSVFKLGRDRPVLTALIATLSLLVVMTGYVAMGRSLKTFLYPEAFLVERIYEAAFTSWGVFLLEVAFMVLVIGVGWIFIYYANRERPLPLYTRLYTHFSRELYVHDIYEWLKTHALRLVAAFSRPHLIAASALLALALLWNPDPSLLAPAVFLPLFPLSVLSVALLHKLGAIAFLVMPAAGALLLPSTSIPDWVPPLAALTALFHTLRLFSTRTLSAAASELYAALLPLAWLNPHPAYLLALSVPPFLFKLLALHVKHTFLTEDLSYVKGLIAQAPGVSGAFLALSFLAYTLPIQPLLAQPNPTNLALLSVSWFLLALGLLAHTGKILWGQPREDIA